MRILTSLLSISWLFASTGLALDTIVLENGDTLTGTILKTEDGKLHFQSEILGEIALPESMVTVKGAETPTAEASEEATPAAEKPKEKAVADAKEEKKPAWNRRIEFGYTDQSGRKDRNDVSFRTNLTWKSELSEIRATGRYLYSANGEKTTDSLLASARYRRTLLPDTFSQVETRYQRDTIKRINHDLQQSIGIGHDLVDNEKVRLAVGGGGAVIYRNTETEPAEWSYAVDAFQDFSYEINRFVKVTQDVAMQTKPFNDYEWSFKVNAALIGTITNSLNMAMRYEYDYDNTLLPDARTSRRLVTSIGYVF